MGLADPSQLKGLLLACFLWPLQLCCPGALDPRYLPCRSAEGLESCLPCCPGWCSEIFHILLSGAVPLMPHIKRILTIPWNKGRDSIQPLMSGQSQQRAWAFPGAQGQGLVHLLSPGLVSSPEKPRWCLVWPLAAGVTCVTSRELPALRDCGLTHPAYM